MLATVYTKALRDRWVGVTIGVGAISLWLLMGVAVYRDIDLSVYTNLPEYIRSLMGIPQGADAAALAVGVIFGFAGAMILASLALSIGAFSIAGEERDGTMGLLLGNPRTRRHVLLSKLGGMVTLIVSAALVLYAATLIFPGMLGVDVGGLHVEALMLHLIVHSLFYGFLAAFVGAVTGERSRASGVAAGVMVLGYFGAGLLPLISGAADVARIFPWHYFDSSSPEINGVAWGHIALLGGLGLAMAIGSVVAFDRRDLKEAGERVTLIDRLRANPRTREIVDRLAGSARVSRISIKTLTEHQALLIIVGSTMFLMMGVLMGPMFLAIDDALGTFMESAPEVLTALVGGADMGTPEGWYQGETFSIMAPAAVIIVTAAIGSKALAGEERNRTMGLLLANPLPRRAIVLEKTISMLIGAVVTGILIWLGVMIGSLIAGLGMSWIGVGAASLLVTLLGLTFGALALALGAATARVNVAVYGTIGVAFLCYLVDAFFPLSESLAEWARFTPWHYYLSSDPLNNGMQWGHAGLLAVLFVVLIGVAVIAFDRRDVRLIG